jgi:hypothetical protein
MLATVNYPEGDERLGWTLVIAPYAMTNTNGSQSEQLIVFVCTEFIFQICELLFGNTQAPVSCTLWFA